jgi:hypothetical protein
MSYYPPQQPGPTGPSQQPQYPQWHPGQQYTPQQPSYYPPTEPGQQQQPFTGYPQWTQVPPPPSPQYTPPMPPKKKSRKTLFIVLGVIVAVVFFGCIGASLASQGSKSPASQQSSAVTQAAQQQPTQAQVTPTAIPPTPKPTPAPKWTTVQSFSGNGSKKTGFFTVPNDWKLVWKCDPASFYGGQYNVIVGVTGSDGTPIDPTAVNTICKTGNTGDSTDEHQGGQVYLDVTSEGSWIVQVQELK